MPIKQHRTRQLGELLKRELAEILQASSRYHPGGLVTVTEVRLSKDLKYADAWISILSDVDKREAVLQRIKQNTGRIRYQLSQRVVLRKLPELRFQLDETLDYAERIDRLLVESGITNPLKQEDRESCE
jgi:ribosome-binding factor A